jgi:hypothetical protein
VVDSRAPQDAPVEQPEVRALAVDGMSKRIKLPPTVKRSSRMKLGKGWRLVNAKRTGSLKAALVATYKSSGDWFAVLKLRD